MNPTQLETPCRVWRGARTSSGYGVRRMVGKKKILIHRWVWEQINGPIPAGMIIMHRCDNPPCYRYDHLMIGTQADNMRDMFRKRRSPLPIHNTLKTHCPAGHPYDEANTYFIVDRRGHNNRQCRICRRDAQHRRDAQRRPDPKQI